MTKVLSFPKLLQSIRKEASLNQKQLAEKLGVSTVLITMIETGQKDPSKKFIKQLAEKLEVKTFSIMPFLSMDELENIDKLSFIEKSIYEIGSKLQEELIKKKSKLLII